MAGLPTTAKVRAVIKTFHDMRVRVYPPGGTLQDHIEPPRVRKGGLRLTTALEAGIHCRAQARTQRDSFIKLRGVRQNNLKHFDLDLPLGKLIVITGLSGSGKSSLAFDTLYAEGQRRYIETFTPYARQFFDRMDKPQVDRIEGIPPAIAIEQRNTVKTTRSTIVMMTEICDHTKVLWATKASLFCRGCGEPVIAEDPQTLWQIWSAKGRSRADHL